MAEASKVCLRIRFKNINNDFVHSDWFVDPRFDEFKNLFCIASYDNDGFEMSDGVFSLYGRWAFENNLDFSESKNYLHSLFNLNRSNDLAIHSLQFEYSDVCGSMLRLGVLTIDISDTSFNFDSITRDFSIDEVVRIFNISDFETFAKDRNLDDDVVSPFANFNHDEDSDYTPSWDYEDYVDDAFINAVIHNDIPIIISNNPIVNELER